MMYTLQGAHNTQNMKYKHTPHIYGTGYRQPRDSIKRIIFTWKGIHIETRKHHHGILAFCNLLAGWLWVR